MKSKKTLITAMGIICFSHVFAQTRFEVTIKNINELKGEIRVSLFDNKNDFLKNAIVRKVTQASQREVTVVFEGLQPGEYGLSAIHDANGNGELDSNFMGIPKEGFAFGNNALGSFGPPDFEKTKIKIDNNPLKHEITLKYY